MPAARRHALIQLFIETPPDARLHRFLLTAARTLSPQVRSRCGKRLEFVLYEFPLVLWQFYRPIPLAHKRANRVERRRRPSADIMRG